MSGEAQPLLLKATKQPQQQKASARDHRHEGPAIHDTVLEEFVHLSSMAAQVSLATVARVALTSIDAVYLGHLGVKELAAASLAQVWTSAPLMAVWASASALITLCGQSWGAGNRELTGVWLQFGLLLTSVLSIPVFVWYWCLGYVLEYSTDDEEVIALAASFSRVTSFAILPSLIYACQRQYLQAIGILMPTTVVGVTSICLAAATNYLFIYGVAGHGGLGFIGSPLSTVFASWFQPLALFGYCFVYRKHHLRAWGGWDWRALTLCRFKAFVTISGPISGNSFVSNLANALVSLVAAKLGAETIAANAVISGMWGLLWALFWGYGCATQVRVANYLGAADPRRAKQVAKLGVLCTAGVVALLAFVTNQFDRDVIAVYTNDEALLRACTQVLPIFIGAFVVESFEVLCGGVLTGMSQVKVNFVTSTIATWCVNLPVAYVGGIVLGAGFPALWVGVLAMEVFKLFTYAFYLARVDWAVMSARAVAAMEVAPEQTPDDAEQSAVNYITAVVGSQPTGFIASLPEPRTPPLSTPFARQRKLSKVARRCNSHEPARSSPLAI